MDKMQEKVVSHFKILSHACLLVKQGGISLIIDPWIYGSCYWRSWWNYPEPQLDEQELKQVTHVLISHIHWDHWHGVSLKKYFKGCQFLIPDEPKTRSYDDLVRLRLGSVQLLQHGKSIHLGHDVNVTVYEFGLFHHDSAIVIETPEVSILNANDAKIAGLPLKHIIKKHGPFDFALRSHSTANFRACIRVENDASLAVDDNEHYSRSFKLFMDAVRPKYAIPFASNHCHLHKDTYHFNTLITNPVKLQNWIAQNGGLSSSELCIMLPGSSWNSETGFVLQTLEPFHQLEQKLVEYHQKKLPILTEYYDYESRQALNPKMIAKHEQHLKSMPRLFRTVMFRGFTLAYQITQNEHQHFYFSVDYKACKLMPIDEASYHATDIKIEWPIVIFNQAAGLKMYAHAFISKRVRFSVNKKENLKNLMRFLHALEKIEHEVFPLNVKYLYRTCFAYLMRWREVWVYVSVLKQVLIHKKSLPSVEEIVLNKSKM